MTTASENCQICDRDAAYVCADCKQAKYCTPDHRMQHWRIHKEQCKVIKQERIRKLQENVERSRLQIRRKYFQHFNHKIYDQCLTIAGELFQLERQHILVTKEIFNEFQYGIAVCLLCRTYLCVDRKLQAKQEMDNYIRQRLHFLEDMRNLPKLSDNSGYPQKAKLFLQRKLALISAVANIYHQLDENCIRYYQIYANHVELVFGPESYELSNAYFAIGNYYREIHENTKAIACFVKAATIRGRKGGGDCYVNISLLYRQAGRLYASIDMMLTAIKLNEEQYGPNSREVGQTYQKLGMLYLDIPDYNNAISNLQSALKIYINQKETEDYDRLKAKIEILYAKMRAIMEKQSKDKKNKMIREQEEEARRRENNLRKEEFNMDFDRLFKVNQALLAKLSPMELYRFSELQMDLQKCRSEFAIAQTIGKSQFFKKLSDNRRRQLRNENEKLFELISMELKIKQAQEESS